MNTLNKPLTKTVLLVLSACLLAAYGGGGSSPSSSPSNTTTSSTSTNLSVGTSLNPVYKTVNWQKGGTVTFPSDCLMIYTSSGAPSHTMDAYYLEPVRDIGGSVVASTAVSGMPLSYTSYTAATATKSFTFNTCPAKASSTTATGGGSVGWMISGSSLFNATEGINSVPPALTDNVSYIFIDTKGLTQTAKFIDSCNGHPTPLSGTYHYHGLPSCVTSIVDTAAGASHIIGVALDGFPIYGNKDVSGNDVTVAQLDACNGITSATPEFPAGIYHYVLPAGVTSLRSSLGCLSGSVSSTLAMAVLADGVCYGARYPAPVVKSLRQRVASNYRSELINTTVPI